MAKVNFGPLANDARGKINGIVYSKNKSGSYTRKKVTPANPNTPAQSAARNSFGTLSQDWSGSLSDSDRAAWNAYAATYPRLDVFGASIKISGLNMYISLNGVLNTIGEPISNTPPASNVVVPLPFDPTSYQAIASALLSFDATAAAASADYEYYIFGSKPLPPGRTVQKNDWRFLSVLPQPAGPYPNAVNVTADYVAKFGNWSTGQRIALLVATVDKTTGLTTVGTILQIISG